MLWESTALVTHFTRHAPTSGLYGQSPFEAAKVDEWIAFNQSVLGKQLVDHVFTNMGHKKASDSEMSAIKKTLNETLAILDKHLDGKSFMVGNGLTIADIVVAGTLSVHYQTAFDASYYDKYPDVLSWLERIVNLPSFVRRFGYLKKPFVDAAPV